jgi:hypothetical protein
MPPGLGFIEAGVGTAQAIEGMIGLGKKKRAANAAVDAINTLTPSQEISNVYQSAKMRSQTGLSGSAKQLALQAGEAAGQAALLGAKDRKSGQGTISSIQAQKQKGALELAKLEDAKQTQNQSALVQAAGLQAREKEKAFKSQQEKQQLKANIAMQEVAAKRAAISQGLGAVAGGLTAGSMSGEKNPLSGALGKGASALLGLFGGKKKNKITAPTSYDENTTENTWG